jgi:hypothetical protein
MIGFTGAFFIITIYYNQLQQWLTKTHSIPCWTTSVFSSTVTDLVLIYESVTSSASVARWLIFQCWTLNFWILLRLNDWTNEGILLNWTPVSSQGHIATDGQSVSKSWCQAPSGAHDQIFITVWQLLSCFCWAPSLTRERVCHLYMLLALASVVFLRSESLGTRDDILLSQTRDFPFRRLLQLAESRWRYSTSPPHGLCLLYMYVPFYNSGRTEQRWSPRTVRLITAFPIVAKNTCFSEPLSINGLFRVYPLPRKRVLIS